MPKHDRPDAGRGQAAGTEVRGDKILVSARKFNKPNLVRRSGQHHATEMVVEKDARAVVLRAYTNQRQE